MGTDVMLLFVVLSQGPLVLDEFISKQHMKFDDLDDAYDYYCDYAKMTGFDMRKGRKSPQVQWVFITRKGTMIVAVWFLQLTWL
jgi:hypothetical protein